MASFREYGLVGIAASAPDHTVLYECGPDRMRAELIALHVVIEEARVRQHLLPVPLSKYRAGFDAGELIALFDDRFWEIRLPDTEAMLARIADVRPCGPDCQWVTEQANGDASALDFVLEHGDACPESESDGPLELEAAA